jgi:hypothetical protein
MPGDRGVSGLIVAPYTAQERSTPVYDWIVVGRMFRQCRALLVEGAGQQLIGLARRDGRSFG